MVGLRLLISHFIYEVPCRPDQMVSRTVYGQLARMFLTTALHCHRHSSLRVDKYRYILHMKVKLGSDKLTILLASCYVSISKYHKV